MVFKQIDKLGKWKWALLIIVPPMTIILVWLIAVFTLIKRNQDKPRLPPPILPAGFFAETITTGISLPVALDWTPDGRMFIARKWGTIRVFKNGALLPTLFIDISDRVNCIRDRGLLDIAVHPDFPKMPYVYLLFTYDPPELKSLTDRARPDGPGNRVSRLIRVTADASKDFDVAIPGSEVVLLGENSTFENIGDPAGDHTSKPSCDKNGRPVEDCLPIDEITHTIGTLAFGTDGSLFVSNGDGSCHHYFCPYRLRAQDLDSLAGKVLRINPMTGDAYPDNPFFDGNPKSNRSRVYSYGLRNPFRFAINPSTNEPFIGDVGWETWEEINSGRGANFGWPCYEGGSGSNVVEKKSADLRLCKDLYENNGATPPIYAWNRAGAAAAAIGGVFYEGRVYPADYRGAFFFGDYIQGWVRYMTPDHKVRDFASGITGLVQITVGPDRNLYYVNIFSGKIVRLRYTGEGIGRHVRIMFLKLRELAYLYPWR